MHKREFGIKEFGNTGHSELNPVDIVAQVNKLCNSIRVLPKGKMFIFFTFRLHLYSLKLKSYISTDLISSLKLKVI